MRRTTHSDGTVTLKAEGDEDLRNFSATTGRWLCRAESPWSGKREDAPYGVQHVDAKDRACPHCGVSW